MKKGAEYFTGYKEYSKGDAVRCKFGLLCQGGREPGPNSECRSEKVAHLVTLVLTE
jgi:hypothetical protein